MPELSTETLAQVMKVLDSLIAEDAASSAGRGKFWYQLLFRWGFPPWLTEHAAAKEFDWTQVIQDLFRNRLRYMVGDSDVTVPAILQVSMLGRLVALALAEARDTAEGRELRRLVRLDGFGKDEFAEDAKLVSANSQSINRDAAQDVPESSTRQLRVFLCHSSGDKPAVRELYRRLQKDAFDPWLDEENLLPGQNWQEEVARAVRMSDVVVICLSKGSVTKEGFLQKEIKFALDVEEEKPAGTIFIIPVRLEEVDVPERLQKWQWADLFKKGGYERLVQALKARAKTLGKPGVSQPAPEIPVVIANGGRIPITDWNDQSSDTQYDSQLYGLGEPELLVRIRSGPFWRIVIRPSEFKKARFQSVEGCREFIVSCCVDVHGWLPYPVVGNAVEKTNEWVAGEVEHDENGVVRRERWALSRSGQFVHNRSFDRFPGIGDRIDILDILDTVTGAFELAGRMAHRGLVSSGVNITFQLNRMAGIELNFPQGLPGPRNKHWCQDESVFVARSVQIDELKRERRGLALRAALEIYSHFGWTDPPREWLLDEQQRRFGAAE